MENGKQTSFMLKQMKIVYFSLHRDGRMDLFVISPVVLIKPGEDV